ncbi:hypothetical protein CK203_085405 [Vitis vinifera]|uniref:Uncharacterized protein n=1 Tax=Vitis vinifera TaxID=29760 RepID=A0A438E4K3_VITVI|nr:hypothetical protein CK203_085405 [Vitis vinifera]
MKRKNRNRFVDNDEFEVANIFLQIPHVIFESESRLPLTWGFGKKISAINPKKGRFVEDVGRFDSLERVSKIGNRECEAVVQHVESSQLRIEGKKTRTGSDVVYPISGPNLSPLLDLNLNIALNFDTTQLKRLQLLKLGRRSFRFNKRRNPKTVGGCGGQCPSWYNLGVFLEFSLSEGLATFDPAVDDTKALA